MNSHLNSHTLIQELWTTQATADVTFFQIPLRNLQALIDKYGMSFWKKPEAFFTDREWPKYSYTC